MYYQLLSKLTDVSIQCRWHKDDGSLNEGFSTSWYSGNHENSLKAYIYITNTASTSMEIIERQVHCKIQRVYGTFLEESGNSHTLVSILAPIKRGKLTMLVSTCRQYKLSNTIIMTWHFCLQANKRLI